MSPERDDYRGRRAGRVRPAQHLLGRVVQGGARAHGARHRRGDLAAVSAQLVRACAPVSRREAGRSDQAGTASPPRWPRRHQRPHLSLRRRPRSSQRPRRPAPGAEGRGSCDSGAEAAPSRRRPRRRAVKARCGEGGGEGASREGRVRSPRRSRSARPSRRRRKLQRSPRTRRRRRGVAAKVDAPTRPAAVAATRPSSERCERAATGSSSAPSRSRRTPTCSPSRFATQASRSRSRRSRAAPAARPRPRSQRHELFVTDASVDKVNAALKGQGDGADRVGGGCREACVRPPGGDGGLEATDRPRASRS